MTVSDLADRCIKAVKKHDVNGITIRTLDMRLYKLIAHLISVPWRRLRDTNWMWEVPGDGEELLTAAGYNTRKIDFAVPQDWLNYYMKTHKEEPRVCWSYLNDELWGEPLFFDTVIRQLEMEQLMPLWENELNEDTSV